MIKKLDFKFVNELRRNEHVKELADKINEVIDGANPLIDYISYNSTEQQLELNKDLYTNGDIECQDLNVNGILYLGGSQSVKKIYCHPISLLNTNDNNKKYRITCLIFNNNSTPFTLSTFKTWFDTLIVSNAQAKLMLSGSYNDTEKTIFLAYMSFAQPNTYFLVGTKTDGALGVVSSAQFNTLFDPDYTTFEDGVNAIN